MVRYPVADLSELLWFDYRIVVPSVEVRQQFQEASEYLHDFWVPLRGKQKRVWYDNYESLDSGFVIINSLMHQYTDNAGFIVDEKIPQPYILAADQRTSDELVKASRYLDTFAVKTKGKGTKKPGSVRIVTLDKTTPALQFLCSLHQQPSKLLISGTPLPPFQS